MSQEKLSKRYETVDDWMDALAPEDRHHVLVHMLITQQFDRSESMQALLRLRLAAEQGNASAQYKLARCVSYDYHNGIRWLRLAAEQGHKSAQHRLGQVLAGRFEANVYKNNPPPDHAEAMKWYRLAADNGLARARKSITELETPTPPDELHKMLAGRTEAQKGDQHIQYRLAWRYCLIKPQDYVRAYLWFSLAAAQGHQGAKKYRDIIGQRMTPAQVAEAQKLEREWKPSPPVNKPQLSDEEISAIVDDVFDRLFEGEEGDAKTSNEPLTDEDLEGMFKEPDEKDRDR